MIDKEKELYNRASKVLVGGVSSSVRVNKALGHPFYISGGDGSKIYDLDGKEYIDMCMSHGAAILGHNNPKIKEAVRKAMEFGAICSYETEYQSKLAEKIISMVPCAELVRLTCSGSEAVMYPLRLAREYTGKNKIVKFEGGFHGYCPHVIFNYSSRENFRKQGYGFAPHCESGGIPSQLEEFIIVLPFNDIEALEKTIQEQKDEIAALIMEPIEFNSGCIIPKPEFLKRIRELTQENNIVLIFDEILSGFRTGPGCAQEYLGVTPDLCTLGKAVTGGLPLSVFGGKREIMKHVRPLGNAQHSGTFNGHLVPVMAAIATLNEISSPGFYDHMYNLADRLYSGLEDIFRKSSLKARVQGVGARFGLYMGMDEEVIDHRDVEKHDKQMYLRFCVETAKRGVFFFDNHGGKAIHHGFSSAHTIEDIDKVLNCVELVMKKIV